MEEGRARLQWGRHQTRSRRRTAVPACAGSTVGVWRGGRWEGPEAPRAPNVPSVRQELPPAGLCGASEHAGPCVTLNDLSHSRPP